jgi:hypothetical protein
MEGDRNLNRADKPDPMATSVETNSRNVVEMIVVLGNLGD